MLQLQNHHYTQLTLQKTPVIVRIQAPPSKHRYGVLIKASLGTFGFGLFSLAIRIALEEILEKVEYETGPL
jgi:hypothetical protein